MENKMKWQRSSIGSLRLDYNGMNMLGLMMCRNDHYKINVASHGNSVENSVVRKTRILRV